MLSDSKALVLAPSDVQLPKAAAERMIDPQTWNALKTAVFGGASDQMTLLAWDYCKARGLDPIKKPVHIVKVWDTDRQAMVETLWEGINSHRVTAARTGSYAGQDDPEFGNEATRSLGGSQVTFPEWCKVRVYRIVGGIRVSFTGYLRWIEAYSHKKDGTPTDKWRKSPYRMLAKCCEAEALRKAFPEELGDISVADEAPEYAGEDGAVDITPKTSSGSRLDAIEASIADRPKQSDGGKHIGLIDPNTGEETRTFSTSLAGATDFLTALAADINALWETPDAARAIYAANLAAVERISRFCHGKKGPVHAQILGSIDSIKTAIDSLPSSDASPFV